AAQRLQEATLATKNRAQTFGAPPVQSTLARAGTKDLYRLPDGSVPQKFFFPKPQSFGAMQTLYKAIGQDRAVPLIRDYAAMTLRRAALMDDGTLNPAKFDAWKAKHQDALRALPPEVQRQFADAGAASRAVADATASRADALKAAQEGA